jgi:hypothetical protein
MRELQNSNLAAEQQLCHLASHSNCRHLIYEFCLPSPQHYPTDPPPCHHHNVNSATGNESLPVRSKVLYQPGHLQG